MNSVHVMLLSSLMMCGSMMAGEGVFEYTGTVSTTAGIQGEFHWLTSISLSNPNDSHDITLNHIRVYDLGKPRADSDGISSRTESKPKLVAGTEAASRLVPHESMVINLNAYVDKLRSSPAILQIIISFSVPEDAIDLSGYLRICGNNRFNSPDALSVTPLRNLRR